MSLSILPRNSGPEAIALARARLKALIEDPLTVLALVGGEGNDAERAIEIASSRASTKPLIRRVVWIPDHSVLPDLMRQDYFPDGVLLATIGLDDKVAAHLSSERAQSKWGVEKAFLAAESN